MVNWRQLKIAVSGTSGIGKSTLAVKLAEEFGLALIEEGYDGKITRQKKKPVSLWEKEYVTVMTQKRELEKQHGAFVTDRCPLDLLAGWFNNGLHLKSDQAKTQRFIAACIKLSRRYDFIVFPPWNSIPFNVTEPGRPRVVRNNNPFTLLRSQASMVGFAHIFLDRKRIIEMPGSVREMDKRIAFVRRQIENRASVLAL